MPTHLAACLIVAVGVLCGIAAVAPPKAPEFQRAPAFLSTRDEIHVELRIEPHQEIRSVTLEAWDAPEDKDGFCLREPLALRRGSSEPVTERNADQRTFRFEWRQSLPVGCYVLIGKSVLARGLTKERRHSLEVR